MLTLNRMRWYGRPSWTAQPYSTVIRGASYRQNEVALRAHTLSTPTFIAFDVVVWLAQEETRNGSRLLRRDQA